jgi:hypothetical protein
MNSIDQTIVTAEIVSTADRLGSQCADISNKMDSIKLDSPAERAFCNRLAHALRDASRAMRRPR